MPFKTKVNWLFNVIQSLVVLTEKLSFFNKQLYGFIISLNSLISISTENTMSEEFAALATAIAIIPKRKNTERKRKRRTA